MKASTRLTLSAGLFTIAGILASPALASEPVYLTGIVRDFKEHTLPGGHADFGATPKNGFGLSAGNIGRYLDEYGLPAYEGGGFVVVDKWLDRKARVIAPHLANSEYESEAVTPTLTSVIMQDSKGVDAYEVTFVSVTYNDDGTSTWVYNVAELDTGKDLSHWLLVLDPSQNVRSGTTPDYDYGVDGSTGYHGVKWDVPESFSEREFTIVLDDHYAGADLADSIVVKGGDKEDVDGLFAPTTTLGGGGGKSGDDDDHHHHHGSFHSCGVRHGSESELVAVSLDDVAGTAGAADDGGIDSAASFDDWFLDAPGVNMSMPLTLTLEPQIDGTWTFDDTVDPEYASLGGFFPIDGRLFADSNGSPDHNFHFTFEAHAVFSYDASGDQFFSLLCDDDAWVFIDGKLAIDLGGIHGPAEQHVDLGRLGLTDGETYAIDIFVAERHRTQSSLRITTNCELGTCGTFTVTVPFD